MYIDNTRSSQPDLPILHPQPLVLDWVRHSMASLVRVDLLGLHALEVLDLREVLVAIDTDGHPTPLATQISTRQKRR
jgi:hypothetical protein